MRIGVDARPLCVGYGGIYRFLKNVFQELQRIDSSNEYYLYTKRDFAFPLVNPRWQKRVLSGGPSRLSSRWAQLGLRNMIAEDALDAFWATSHFFPLGLPYSLPKVLTVYDLVWHRHPGTMGFRSYLMHRLFADQSILKADHIITISESTAADLQELDVGRDKISIVYPGPEARYKPLEQKQAAQFIANKYGTSENYICAVGTVEPRKNLVTLLEAVCLLRRRTWDFRLLVAGMPGWRNSGVYESVKRLGLTEAEVMFLGHVPDDDMPALYSGSRLFVFPSLYEGFGIPLVEAMACGIPVVASNSSSIPEVVQDAAVLVSPRSPQAFADAISRVVCDSELRSSLVAKGLRRAADFSWESSAKAILDLLASFGPAAQKAGVATARFVCRGLL
jgi:glycosyltransferase involved in cell wall biosynthesis